MELKNREIFTENLSKRKGVNNQIDWKNSVGYKVKGIYDDIEFEVEIVDYADGYMWIKYLDKEPFKIATGDFQDCKIGKLLGKITNEFKVEINTTFKDDNRNITVVDRKYINSKNNRQLFKYYQYKCNVCGWQGDNRSWIMESNLLKGIGCSCCASQTVVEKINSIVAHKETHWMIPYFQGGYNEAKGYTPRSNKKLYFKCLDCDRVKDKEISINNLYTNHSIGCSCGDGMSYGHKYTYNLLEQLKLDFKQNNTLDWCKFYNIYKNKEATGEYDFVIENLKLIIEVDGKFHRNDNKMNGQTKEESNYLDKEKTKLAKEHGYDVIRIIYYDDSEMKKPILDSEMINHFDLSLIDWNKCEEFALSNLVKKACEYKRDNPNISTSEIGSIMKLSQTTVRKYLRQGSKIWNWIDYNAKEETSRNSSKNGKMFGKQVEIFKNNSSLVIFISASELERQSESLFGIKLMRPRISEACRENKEYKGFTFKYVNNNNETQKQVASF